MHISNEVRKYIELALRQHIAESRPDYAPVIIDAVVEASMNGLHVSKETLYKAIDLAIKDQHKATR